MCHHQIAQLRDQLESIKDLDAEVLVIDPHESWAAKALLKDAGLEADDVFVPVLLDPSLTVSATYGVAFQMRIHEEVSNRPATFIIDKKGILRYERRAEHFADRPRPKDIVQELKNLKP